MRPEEFKLECNIFTGRITPIKKELVDFGVIGKSIHVKHGDHPEIIIDKDLAKAILQKVASTDSVDYKALFEKYLGHIREVYGHACLDEIGLKATAVVFNEPELEYFKTLNITN